jgi:hypothetical protein
MIEVPADTFALLFAYCFTSAPKVPLNVRAHPDYPANRDHKRRHLTQALRPYAEKAFASLGTGTPSSNPPKEEA